MNSPCARSRTLILPAVTLALAACSGLLPVSTPTPTSPAPTETPTVVWFPPTNTPTSPPAATFFPTSEPLPGIGDLLFADDFSDASLWNVADSGRASSQVQDGRLILALDSGPQSIASLRSGPMLGDFYAEVIAGPHLCSGGDQYGMLFHASSVNVAYRFVLTCEGNIRLERLRGGGPEVLQNWVPSAAAPRGSPSVVKIGVWMSGTEMRFLLNDYFQFSLRDPVLRSGTLGFFAYADGGTPMLVAFSALKVYAVSYVSPTPSLTPTRTATPTRSTP